jgi:hypothetical protein
MKRTQWTNKPERGIAMLAALFALLLLTAIAVGMMYLANSETQVNANFKSSQRAFWGARAGLEEARARLYTGKAGSGDLLALAPITLPGNVGSVLYVSRPGILTPWTGDGELCREFNPTAPVACAAGLPNPAWATRVDSQTPLQTTTAPPFEWVRVTLKRNDSSITGTGGSYLVEQNGDVTREICWNGTSQLVKPAGVLQCDLQTLSPRMTPVYMLESYAIAPGGASRYAQMEVANNPPISTNSAVDSQDVVVLQGSLDISGFDACGCICADGTTFCANPGNRPGHVCDKSKWAIYSQNTITQNGNGSLFSGMGPGNNPPGTSQMNDGQGGRPMFPYDIPAMIDTFKNDPSTVHADYPCYSGGPQPCGLSSFHLQNAALGGTLPVPFPPTYPANQTGGVPQVTYYGDGNSLDVNAGSQGNGILIVDGDLTIHGGFNWYGLILVKGIVNFTGGGSSQNIWGAILNGTSVTQNDVLGGSSTITYDRCALDNTQGTSPPKMLSFREITY